MTTVVRSFISLVVLTVLAGCVAPPASPMRLAKYVPRQPGPGVAGKAQTVSGEARRPGGEAASEGAEEPGVKPPSAIPGTPPLRSDTDEPRRPATDFASRTFQAGDKITISLMGIREPLMYQTVIDEHGLVNLPYLTDVKISGKTKSEAEKMIVDAYVKGEIYRVITVSILPPDVEYFLRGEVNRPGGYPLTRNLGLLQALSIAGGYTEFADPTEIKVIRASETLTVNARKVESGSEKNLIIQPGDVIVVPRHWY